MVNLGLLLVCIFLLIFYYLTSSAVGGMVTAAETSRSNREEGEVTKLTVLDGLSSSWVVGKTATLTLCRLM